MEVAIGSRIGVAIRMMGAISMMHPRTSRIRFSSRARRIGLLVMPVMVLAARSGTCSWVRQNPKILDVAINIITMDKVSTQSPSTLQTPFQSSPL